MDNPLGPLLEEGIVSEVLGRLQSGKEAEVFLVRYGERVVAAKVYKDRAQRSFKNKSAYQEGRSVRNTRDQRAMGRRSSFGKETEEEAWKSAEVDAMYRLHAAEVRVPAPVLFFEGVLLMDLVLDQEGVTARRLIDTTLSPEQANAAYHDMLTQLVRMLNCDLIHGDLSPYNVLWGAAGPTIIDFPQIVSAAQNSSSERFFLRDAENILGFFRAIDPRLDARRGDAVEIWRAYVRRELTADFVPTGRHRPPPPPPPQKPLPIGILRPATGARPSAPQPQYSSRGDSPQPQRQPQAGAGYQQPRPQQGRGGPPTHQENRGGSPQQQRPQSGRGGPQQERPQQGRGGGPQQPQGRGGAPQQPQGRGGAPQQQQSRGGGPQQPQGRGGTSQYQPHQGRGGAQQQPQGRGGAQQQRPQQGRGGPSPQRHAGQPARNGSAPSRRAMPEVIVRPRVPSAAPSREAQATESAHSNGGREQARAPDSKRGSR